MLSMGAPDALVAASVSKLPRLVGDGHTDETVFWQGAPATETIMVSK
jgi:hypothetical protein